MSVKVRLTRMGTHKKAFYRVVVASSDSPRDGRFIEKIGTYNPHLKENKFNIDNDKLSLWIKKGAQPTEIIRSYMNKALA